MKLAELKDIEFLSSGIEAIDDLIGGLPLHRIIEIYGSEGIGKSYLMAKITAAATSQKKKVFYLDSEQSANKARMEALGVDSGLVDYSNAYELEEASEAILEALKHHDLVIIDSIATLTPKNILDGELGEANIGLYSRHMAKFIKKLKPAVNEFNAALVCVNQYRQSPDMFKPRYVPGGTAYMHALDLRLELSTTTKDKIESKGVRTGHWVNVHITKNRLGKPYAKTRFKLEY